MKWFLASFSIRKGFYKGVGEEVGKEDEWSETWLKGQKCGRAIGNMVECTK